MVSTVASRTACASHGSSASRSGGGCGAAEVASRVGQLPPTLATALSQSAPSSQSPPLPPPPPARRALPLAPPPSPPSQPRHHPAPAPPLCLVESPLPCRIGALRLSVLSDDAAAAAPASPRAPSLPWTLAASLLQRALGAGVVASAAGGCLLNPSLLLRFSLLMRRLYESSRTPPESSSHAVRVPPADEP